MINLMRALLYGSLLVAIGYQLPLSAQSYSQQTTDRPDLDNLRNRSRYSQGRYQVNYNYYGTQPSSQPYQNYGYNSGYGGGYGGYGGGYSGYGGNGPYGYGYYGSPPPPTPNQAFPDSAAANDLYRYLQSR